MEGTRSKHRTRLDISSPRLAPGLWLRPEGSLERHREVELGDDTFDRVVSVQGPPALAFALLDAELRRSISALMNGRLEVQGHELLIADGRLVDSVLRLELSDREQQIARALRAGLDLAARLTEPEDVAERLLERLKAERNVRVRLGVLTTILREFEGRTAAREAVAAARRDPHPDLRLRAGDALGVDGREVLLGVALDEAAEDVTSASAVAALRHALTVDVATRLFERARQRRHLATARACLEALGRRGGPEAIRTLVHVLSANPEPGGMGVQLAIDAAAALATTGDTAAEQPLLSALAAGSPWLKQAAVEALGRVGTRAAVPPLRAVMQEAALRAMARQAIAQIHARLAGAEQGQLSLAEGEAGRLSLSEDKAGQLSLPDDPGGVRS